jgi:glycosyltransferase involved in cell wall biosynthesis
MNTRFHIIYDFREGPYGGGNQFLKALRAAARNVGVYAEREEDADFFLFNGYPFGNNLILQQLLRIKSRFTQMPFVYRIDGPTHLLRGRDKDFDIVLKYIADALMDGVVFQSDWSRRKNQETIGLRTERGTVIPNAPDAMVFNRTGKGVFCGSGKIRLIATSWSSNMRKGFDYYQFLDQHLDFEAFSMTFVGNTPVRFTNIKVIEPITSAELSCLLKDHDIYVTASRNDPCSNSLIEALATGLPAVVINDGGHPELIGEGGVTFNDERDMLRALEDVAQHYHKYAVSLPKFDLLDVLNRYVSFGESICQAVFNGSYQVKRMSLRTKTLSRLVLGYLDTKRFIRRVKDRVVRTFKGGHRL